MLGIGVLGLCTCTTIPMFAGLPQSAAPLDFYQWVQAATPQERLALQQRVEQQLTQACALQPLVQLAILKSAVETSAQEDESALATLKEIDSCAAAKADAGDYRVFASLWTQLLAQRQTMRLNGRQIQTLEEQRQALSEQIDALTNIEEQLNRR
jgi:chaperonin cofactor prefoldin